MSFFLLRPVRILGRFCTGQQEVGTLRGIVKVKKKPYTIYMYGFFMI
jgi:hypothetical protein